MIRESKLAKLLALLFSLSLIAAACGDDDGDTADGEGDTETEETTGDADAEEATDDEAADDDEATDGGSEGGTLIWAHEQEPPDLHLDDPNNNLSVTSWIRKALLEGLFGVDSTTSFYPELLADEPAVDQNDDGTVAINYVLRDGLQWSDGTPLTASDVEYTWNIISEGCETEADGSLVDGGAEGCVYLLGDRSGYELITNFEVVSDTEFTVQMTSFFAGWKEMFEDVYAAHAFGADAAEVNENLREWSNADGPLPASGPMIFDSWERGVSMSMVRNDNYHGSNSPDATNTGPAFVDSVQVNFVADTDAQINALLAGEAQIIFTQPQLEFERLAESEDFTVASTAGPVYEHWGFNVLNPHLAKAEVREAIAYGIDKSEIMAGLYTPLFGSVLPAEGLGNVYWMSNQPDYEDAQTQYAGANVDEAKASLEAAGYTEGSDGIYEHPEDGRLSLRVGTTGGNGLRELQQELIQAQLANAGIEIVIDNVAGAAYFSERPFAEEALAAAASGGAEGDPTIWDITQFAWVGGPWPGSSSASYTSGSGNNPYGFANTEFDAKAAECDATVDDAERAACYNEANRYVTTLEFGDDGLVVVPLTQKPSFYGYLSAQLSQAAVAPDADAAGPLTNVADFQFQ